MDSSWVSLISAALHSKAYKTSSYVAAGSYCEILFDPEVIQVNYNVDLKEPLLYTDAILTNIDKRTFSTAKFILPSPTPLTKTSSYRISFNDFHDVCIVQLRGATYNAELLAQALSFLSIHQTSSTNDDGADPIQNLDLDKVFGGSATDLEGEDEDAISRALPPFHHLNFLGYPVYHKSSTPAEVSFWLTVTSHKKQVFHSFSRQGVITSQATKLIDPFVYLGPELGQSDISELSGTELTNFVAGRVEKAYAGQGAWLRDSPDQDDKAPRNADTSEDYVWQHGDSTGELQLPHWMSHDDCDDIIINDNGKGLYKPTPRRRNPGKAFKYKPSGIRVIAELEAAEVAARKRMLARMRAVKLNIPATSEENVEERSEDERENEGEVAEVLCGDLDQIRLERGSNKIYYGPIAIAVGHKAFQLVQWVSSRFW